MEQYRHIFLTGEKRIGKSTVWKNVLERSGLQPAGFLTLPYDVNGRFRGFCLHALHPVSGEMGNDVPISVQFKAGTHIGIAESFDVFGTQLLRSAVSCSQLILMDELGKFERNAHDFQQAVTDCLDSPATVIGVLQHTDNAFLDQIRQREDVLILTVTEENRNLLPNRIIALLTQK